LGSLGIFLLAHLGFFIFLEWQRCTEVDHHQTLETNRQVERWSSSQDFGGDIRMIGRRSALVTAYNGG